MTTCAPSTGSAASNKRVPVDILLVDDEPGIRNLLTLILETNGYSLVCAENGKLALDLLTTHRFRLVITDIFMPGSDGLEFMVKHRAACPGVPVVAISGGGSLGGSENMLKAARFLGCKRTLQKPFDIPELLSVIRELLADTATVDP